MDTRTGKIFSQKEIDEAFGGIQNLPEHVVEIQSDEMTEKQLKTQQVSKHDNKSKLGKRFTAARHQRNYFFKRK